VATKPQIVAAPNRGNYSVKGTPRGITIPKIPVAVRLLGAKRVLTLCIAQKGRRVPGTIRKLSRLQALLVLSQ
jgi:hypothetical protein